MKIKIIFVINTLGEGGTQRFFFNLINNLDKNKFEIILVLTMSKGDYLKDLDEKINIIELNCKKARYFPLKLYKILKEENPELVVSGLMDNNLLIGLTLAKMFKKIKFIARESIVLSEAPSIKKNKLKKKLIQISYKSFDKIVAQSEDMYDDLKKNYMIETKKIIKINNMVDENKINQFLEQNKEIEMNRLEKNILCVGRLTKQKGFDLAIKGFSKVKDSTIKLYIMGEGPEEIKLKEEVERLNLDKRVVFLGKKNNPYIYMRNSDLFILSSRFEGFPNVLLEANMCGIFALANNCPGGINEIITENINGNIIDFKNEELVAQKIENILKKEKNSDQIKKYILSKYNVDNIVEKYMNLFIEVIGEKNE